MNMSTIQTRLMLKLAGLLAAGATLVLSGCSQETAVNTMQIGQGRWARVNDVPVPITENVEPPVIKAETFLATGRLLESQGNFIQAARLYQQACQSRADYVAAWSRLGIVCDKLGRYPQAEHAFQQAISHASKAAFLHNNLGFTYLLAGKYAQAEKSLRRALAINAQFQRARVNLGLALAKQGQHEAGLAEFRKALPEAQAYYNIAYLHRLEGHWELAGNCYQRALELDPDLADAQTQLVLCEQTVADND